VLFTEERDPDQKLKLMLFMTPPLILGVALRLVSPAYRFADLSIEGAFLMGLLADVSSDRSEERLSRFQRWRRTNGLACRRLPRQGFSAG